MPENSSGYVFFVGDDDFLVDRAARARWEKESAGAFDEMSKEIVEGVAIRVDDVVELAKRFVEAARTVSLFGGKKYVWLRNVNWLSDGTLSKSEKTAGALKRIADAAATMGGDAVFAMISVIKPDKRLSATKSFFKLGELNEIAGGNDPESLCAALDAEARRLGVSLDPDAAQVLVEKVNLHSRMSHVELEKLACYVGHGATIDAETVLKLVPVFGEGDQWEPVEVFFSGNLSKTLDSLRSYFFNNNSARPLLTTLQKRNSLLIQLRALLDAGDAKLNFRGEIPSNDIRAAGEKYGAMFGGNDDKSSYNLFSQNAWYAGSKVAKTLKIRGITLRRLIDWQLDFLNAFEQLITRPGEDEAVMRELATRCLGK
ncbi:MAG: hypothetical protein LUD39_05055 [Opitutae bacterium]|nr:hypothetical protein [Opitutae bacterium]